MNVFINKETLASVDRLVRINRRITTRVIAEEMSMSKESVHTQYCMKGCNSESFEPQWAPKHLTEEQKIHRMSLFPYNTLCGITKWETNSSQGSIAADET
ncbi:hypothetical protein TNCT_372941 [Trichonephila clavata]|uniref:Uncharacterized protein n=1 Tax=Trichonephila clavata TaxID=2740835 RepID=A0A8X6M5J8_TRICU|nr:hypothetical protein TNCT_372941 [Trichonephila clavata]